MYRVLCNGRLSLASDYLGPIRRRVAELRSAVGPVTLEVREGGGYRELSANAARELLGWA